MAPAINDGDLIIYKPFKESQEKLLQGYLVVVKHPIEKNTLIVKRISKVHSSSIEILGDNQIESIDSRHFGAIRKTLIKGIVKVFIQNKKSQNI